MTNYAQNILAWTPGWPELLIILVIALLIFGKRLPDIARGFGKSLNEFKKGMKEVEDSTDEVTKDINKIKNDVINETRDAAGLNDTKRDH